MLVKTLFVAMSRLLIERVWGGVVVGTLSFAAMASIVAFWHPFNIMQLNVARTALLLCLLWTAVVAGYAQYHAIDYPYGLVVVCVGYVLIALIGATVCRYALRKKRWCEREDRWLAHNESDNRNVSLSLCGFIEYLCVRVCVREDRS